MKRIIIILICCCAVLIAAALSSCPDRKTSEKGTSNYSSKESIEDEISNEKTDFDQTVEDTTVFQTAEGTFEESNNVEMSGSEEPRESLESSEYDITNPSEDKNSQSIPETTRQADISMHEEKTTQPDEYSEQESVSTSYNNDIVLPELP